MGWFLPGNAKKKAAKRKPAAKKTDRAKWDPARTLLWLRVSAWALFIGVLAAGWFFGEKYLRAEVARQQSTMPRVELIDLPVWMEQWVVDDLRRTIAAAVDPNPFEQLSLQEVAAELQFNPWVRQVDRVLRKPEGVIEIRAAYRKPAALIAAQDGYHLIDIEGVRLPPIYGETDALSMKLPILVGVRRAPPAMPGGVWPGGDVEAGLKLAMLVVAQPWREQVLAIDVSNHDGRQDAQAPYLALRTARGLVRWGRAPGAEGHYEPPHTKKLAHIQRIVNTRGFRGRIDADGRTVDVFSDVPFIHDPIAQSPQ